MPVLTEEGEDAVVTAWMVDEGSRVKKGQLIAEVQGEKVALDVEAPADGVATGLVGINQPVPQGSPICRIEEVEGSESPPPPERPAEATSEKKPPAAAAPASPAARRLARELGISLSGISGSGPGGRITETDVRRSAGETTGTADEAAGMSGLRAVIARNMRQSHATTAPVTLTTTADVTGRVPEQITAWVVRSVAICLGEHPDLNGVRDGDSFRSADRPAISLAIQTDAGLVAPVVSDPAARSLEDLHEEIARLAERARSRQLTGADYEGGTFSVTNLGAYGIDAFTPIINLPQVAILGVGAIRTAPGYRDGELVPRQEMALSLTFDHAFVDGAPAAEFLARVRRQLEEAEAG
jgi:pyruvate dehydrogenase E2 component (dihydrolipoamide acetyltransferase)